MTRYEYDDEDRMVASFTTTESEYSAMDYAELQALEIFEASLCPGCSRPMDVCAADYKAQRPFMVDQHVCMASLALAVQHRIDQWTNTPTAERPDEAPLTPKWSDGLMQSARPARPDELAD